MNPERLDFIFPFFVLFYGVVITFVTHNRFLMKVAEIRMPEYFLKQLEAHRLLALVCVAVGGLWALQNMWL